MTKKRSYIKLFYSEKKGYKIILIIDGKEMHLNSEDAKIMFETLKNFNCRQLDKEEYIFMDVMPILISFYRNRKKTIKQEKNTVNRTKSKNIAIGTALAVTVTLGVGGIAYATHSNNQNKKPLNNQIIEETTLKDINNNNEDKLIGYFTNLETEKNNFQTENLEELQDEIEEFHYYDDKIGDQQALENTKKFDEIFEKYEKRYGIDKNLLRAIAAQESSGRQSATNGYASGIMGIEYIWADKKIEVYNFETQKYEEITIDYEKVKEDVEYCIMVGAGIVQKNTYTTINSNLIPSNEILAYATQRYNMGPGNMQTILQSGLHWIEGRNLIETGDSKYFENVFSRLENGTIIKIKLTNEKYLSFSLTNDALELEATHSRY